MGRSKSKSKSKKKNNKKKTNVKKTINTVIPVTTPVGSVHFDEFLNICKQPKLPIEVPKDVKPKGKKGKKGKKSKKGKKGKKGKKNKKSRKKGPPKKSRGKNPRKKNKKGKNKKPEAPVPIEMKLDEATLFPLTKALMLATDDDAINDIVMLSEFVVGNNEKHDLKSEASVREVNIVEEQANSLVDRINEVQKKINTIMQKPKLNESDNNKLEEYQLEFISLLNDFEYDLKKIQDILNEDQKDNSAEEDDDGWIDIDDTEDTQIKRHRKICSITKQTDKVKSHTTDVAKWYEGTDLAYLLSPNTSFENGMNLSMSSGVLNILDELKDQAKQNTIKRNEVFKRLKKKFSILLPPPKTNGTKENLIWIDQKLYKDHQKMLNSTNKLKIFQCWDQFELKYNIICALIISLKDAIKSTPPLFYASKEIKAQFVAEQSSLVQALDDFKRKTNQTFLQAGLNDYWEIYPESIRLGSRPCFDVTIRQRDTEIDKIIPLGEQNLSFLQRNPFLTNGENCKNDNIKTTRSNDSEIEMRQFPL